MFRQKWQWRGRGKSRLMEEASTDARTSNRFRIRHTRSSADTVAMEQDCRSRWQQRQWVSTPSEACLLGVCPSEQRQVGGGSLA